MIDDRLPPATVWHFQEQKRTHSSSSVGSGRLSEDMYGAVLDHLVIACVDVVFTHKAEVLLVKRNRYPRRSWWIVGGRMKMGESPLQTAIRKTSQELNLHSLDASRLRYVGTYSTCFAFRHQPPQHHGSHTLNVTYCAELTAIEREQIALHPSEHETWQWFAIDQVSELLDTNEEMDRALSQVILDVKRLQTQGD